MARSSTGSRLLGAVILVLSTVGVVAGVAGALVGGRLVADLGADAAGTLQVSAQAVRAADETIDLASAAIGDLEAAVATAQDAAASASVALADSEMLIAEVARIAGEDIPGSLRAVDDAMPALVRVAGVIDGTLRAFAFFGADYDPEQPFDDAVRDLDTSLSGLPERLEVLAGLLEESTGDLATIADTATDLAGELDALQGRVASTSSLLADYRTTAGEAERLITTIEADLPDRVRLARIFVTVAGVAFAGGQLASLYVGARLFGGAHGAVWTATVGGEPPDGDA